jgi:hypothetical protein
MAAASEAKPTAFVALFQIALGSFWVLEATMRFRALLGV